MSKLITSSFNRTLLAVAIEVMFCGAAFAQAAPAAGAPESQATNGYNEADQNPAGDTPAVVVVKGTRAALADARDRKKNAEVVMDSISATELGRFPDDNVADSLTHITGVTVTRAQGGEAESVSIRGLGPGFNIVTFNNRILATDGDGRDFAFDVLPSEVVSGADVMKSAQASQIEGGLAGIVNLRSAHAMDNPGQHSGVRIEGMHNDLSQLNGTKMSGFYSNTFADNSVGVLVGAVYQKQNFRSDRLNEVDYDIYQVPTLTPSNNTDHLDGTGLTGLCCYGVGSYFEKKERAGLSASVEWKPNDALKFTVDALATRLKDPRIGNIEGWYPELSYDANGMANWSNMKVNNGYITAMTVRNFNSEVYTNTQDRNVDTGLLGFKTDYKVSKDLKLTGDIYRSTSTRKEGGLDAWVVAGIAGNNILNAQTNPGGVPSAQVTLANGMDLATASAQGLLGNGNYGPHWAGLSGTDVTDGITGASLAGRLQTAGLWNVDNVDFGWNYTDRRKVRNTKDNQSEGNIGGGQYATLYNNSGAGAGVGPDSSFAALGANVVSQFAPVNFMRGSGGNFPKTFVTFNVPAYFAALKKLDGTISPIDGHTFDSTLTTNPVLVPTQSYDVTEKTNAFYAQANLSGEQWAGNFGLRLVHTATVSKTAIDKILSFTDSDPTNPNGNNQTQYSNSSPLQQDGSYTKLLPSANFGYWFAKDLQGRMALSQTMARPDLSQLSPQGSDQTLNRQYVLTYSGNADLKPYTSNNLDLSLEWYYAPKSMLTGGVFYKHITDFITSRTLHNQDIGVIGTFNYPTGTVVQPQLYDIIQPINGDSAAVKGVELGLTHLFNNGFGVDLKYAKTWSSQVVDGVHTGELDGVAGGAASVGLLYEAHGLSASVSFEHTSSYTVGTAGGTHSTYIGDYIEPEWRVSSSVTYDINSNLAVFVEGKNLSDTKFKSHLIGRSDLTQFEVDGRTYVLGLKATF